MEIAAMLFILLAGITTGSPQPCELTKSILLQSPRVLSNGTVVDTVQEISYPPGTHFEIDGAVRACPCKIQSVPCLRKCCPLGMAFGSELACVPFGGAFMVVVTVDANRNTITVNGERHFALLVGKNCRSNKSFLLEPEKFFEDEFFIRSSDGILTTPHHSSEEFGVDKFCIDYSTEMDENRVLMCISEDFHDVTESLRIKSILYPILMIISVPPLLVTFLVYAFIKRLRNLHGKCLMCYVLCLTVSYIVLAISHLALDVLSDSGCIAVAFLSQFSLLGSFFWLNVICIDICLTYCAQKQSSESVHRNERKKFIYYSVYAWFWTCAIVIISLIMDFTPGIPEHYFKPRFGRSRCWFDRKMDAFIYFYLPFSILILSNIIMYVFTALKVNQLKKSIKKNKTPQHRTRTDKDNQIRFKLYFKLLLMMGVIWITEIIGWAVDSHEYYWLLVDAINCLQGVLIFLLFVWQERVRNIIRAKFDQETERQSAGWICCGKILMIHKWGPSKASETRDTTSSDIQSHPMDSIPLNHVDETSRFEVTNNEESQEKTYS